mmetsp:Transcript_14091/g.17116  ORF Transcript_14091/g.17116 Transcript_14091/m.17116 type:complete len:359 (+) Transcript_14091:255-1331(+)
MSTTFFYKSKSFTKLVAELRQKYSHQKLSQSSSLKNYDVNVSVMFESLSRNRLVRRDRYSYTRGNKRGMHANLIMRYDLPEPMKKYGYQCMHFSNLSDKQSKNKSDTKLPTHIRDDIEKEHKSQDQAKSTNISKQRRNQIRSLLTQAKSIPNIITIARIGSIPFLCNFIITEQFQIAVIGCFLAGFSDWLDGYVAKKYNQVTVLGTYLDPLADKAFINSIALSLSYVDILPQWCAAIWLGRDALLIGMSYRYAAIAAKGRGHAVVDPERTPLKVTPTLISKVNTVFQFGLIGAGLSSAAAGDSFGPMTLISLGSYNIGVIESMTYVTCGTTIWSGLSYLGGKSMVLSGNSRKGNSNKK